MHDDKESILEQDYTHVQRLYHYNDPKTKRNTC